MTLRRTIATAAFSVLAVTLAPDRVSAQPEIVVYAADVATLRGNWTRTPSSTAAAGQYLSSADRGWAAADAPLASPTDYFETTVSAAAGASYHLWLRSRASADSKWNDSVWVQFSDAVDQTGAPIYRIGTTSGLLVNLENCSGCGVAGWGWQDKSYWLTVPRTVRFPTNGSRQIRVQTREDGVQIDQIVLSSATYLVTPPGQLVGDTTIVAKPAPPASPSSSPYSGTPAAIPGTLQAQDFDNGGRGIAYQDADAGNAGGAYRQTDVDLESSAEGGANLGWTAAGEWLNYTVDVAAAGTYTLTFRVASQGAGGTFHLEMNRSNVTGSLTIPNSGGWQAWTTVSKSVTLAAGRQTARLVFDAAGPSGAIGNLKSLQFVSASAPSGGSTTPYTGSPAPIPGTIRAEAFDNGGEGIAYHDSGASNAGGAVRQTGVDLEASSDGGYNIGWTAAGEWVNYTVNVAQAGKHNVKLRVASANGAAVHVGFNGGSSVWQALNIPNTGGWQSWTDVSFQATLAAGRQVMTVLFDNGNVNLNHVAVTGASTPTPTLPPASDLHVLTWNILITDYSEAHARRSMERALAVSPQPQVITTQESIRSYFYVYIDELQRRTGVKWYGAVHSICASGDWNGGDCTKVNEMGVAIFSRFPILNASTLWLPYEDCWTSARPALRAAIAFAGRTVQIFTTHLQTGSCNDVMQQRYRSMADLKQWALNFSTPQLFSGDFNADPDQIATPQGMAPNFVDAFGTVGTGSRFTFPQPNPTMQLDYWFFDRSWQAQPISSAVVTSTGSESDHLPVRATFRIR